MASLIKAYEDGTLAALQAAEREEAMRRHAEIMAAAPPHVLDQICAAINRDVDDLDDDVEPWCSMCHNTGSINCHCGGDLCVCDNNGEEPCPFCDGTGDDFYCEEIDDGDVRSPQEKA